MTLANQIILFPNPKCCLNSQSLCLDDITVNAGNFFIGTSSVVSPKWLEFRRKGFWPPAKREGKSTAARRVAPKMALGFVASRSQVHGDMLPRRASPKAILGATKHQPFRRHYTSKDIRSGGKLFDGYIPVISIPTDMKEKTGH